MKREWRKKESEKVRKCVCVLTFPGSLALCEIHFAVVALAVRVMPHMSLFETTEEDVQHDHDMFIPMAKAGSKGIRVTIS